MNLDNYKEMFEERGWYGFFIDAQIDEVPLQALLKGKAKTSLQREVVHWFCSVPRSPEHEELLSTILLPTNQG